MFAMLILFSFGFAYRTAIGLRVKDGVVLGVEKLVQSKLLVAGANRRIQSADLHIGMVRWSLS
jgi:20S proteasome alpha/beta subunit